MWRQSRVLKDVPPAPRRRIIFLIPDPWRLFPTTNTAFSRPHRQVPWFHRASQCDRALRAIGRGNCYAFCSSFLAPLPSFNLRASSRPCPVSNALICTHVLLPAFPLPFKLQGPAITRKGAFPLLPPLSKSR